jgi:EmrB/QacA subfamily drug resistance transporter
MSKQQRIVLVVSILATFVAILDGSIVNVALPAIAGELGGGLTTQQWVVNSYLITLGALILIAGSLSDLFGRKKILMIGMIGFGITSLLCAVAPTALTLIIARGLQGVAGALLVPSALALIMSTFSGVAKSKAIGQWTAWTVIAPAVGPIIGGLLVDAGSWRWVFALNIVPILAGIWLMRSMHIKEERDESIKVDLRGALLCTVGLAGVVFALVEQAHFGWADPIIYIPLVVGLISLVVFFWYERRARAPMLPLALFRVGNFSVGNITTLAVYGGLSVGIFLLSIFVQQIGHYSATWAGIALIPPTIFMFALSSLFGSLAGKHGSRFFMAVGPLVMAVGFLTMLTVDESVNYWLQIFPGVMLFGLGLSITVAPLTTAILGSIDTRQSGIGSAINNAVARIAGLLGVAALGFVIGPNLTLESFHQGMIFTAALFAVGGVVSAIGIKNAALQESPR